MNSYELNILLESEGDAISLMEEYESIGKDSGRYLEEVIPKLFKSSFKSETQHFCIDYIERNTNEIIIGCYGSKYPSFEVIELFTSLTINVLYGIKIKVDYDGDGTNDVFCIVNSDKCSPQKYNAYYRKNKIGYEPKGKKNPLKKVHKKEKTDQEKLKETIKEEQNSILEKELCIDIKEEDKSAIIRLLIRGKKKREIIKNIFLPCLPKGNEINYEQFCKEFNSVVSHEDYELSWCFLKRIGKHYYDWAKGPEDLIKYLTTVFEQGNYIYLGFNLKNIPDAKFDPNKYRVNFGVAQFTDLESLAFIMAAIEGVNKANIKYRPTGMQGKEHYSFYPDSGREEPRYIFGTVTKDYEWPTD